MLAFIFGTPGWMEMVLLGVVGLLIFGRRLPEVGKNLGKGIVEFKKGLSGLEDDIDNAGTQQKLDSQSNESAALESNGDASAESSGSHKTDSA
jgi:sec-independent protein translocase protein TatA